MEVDNYMNLNPFLNFEFTYKRLVLDYDDKSLNENIFIVMQNKKNKYMKISPISRYFIINMRNLEFNTKKYYAKEIVAFLNFTLIDNYLRFKVSNINDIKIKHANEYIQQLADGKLGKQNKTKERIQKIENILTNFFYNFIYEQKTREDKKIFFEYNFRICKKTIKDSVFIIKYKNYRPPRRVKNLSKEFLSELMYSCDLFYPNLKLAVALQAFAGLRSGEVCNVTFDKIKIKYIGDRYGSFSIDLSNKTKIRKDDVNCGDIKKYRIQYIHPIFLDKFQEIYNSHIENMDKKNEYLALFINRNGDAMTVSTYVKKFKIILEKTIERIMINGDINLLGEANNIISNKCATHVLRHFFTKEIVKNGGIKSAAELASWRGDSSLESAIVYLADSAEINDRLLRVQEDMFDELKGK